MFNMYKAGLWWFFSLVDILLTIVFALFSVKVSTWSSHLNWSEETEFYKTPTWIRPSLVLEKHVQIEVAGDVDNIHQIECNLADRHHRDKGRGELGQRIHAGLVEDQAQPVFAGLLLVIDIDEDIEEAVKNAHDKEWKGKCIPLENPLNFVLETSANVNESKTLSNIKKYVSPLLEVDLRIDVRAQKRRLSKAVSRISPVIQVQSLICIFLAAYVSLSCRIVAKCSFYSSEPVSISIK